jgi:(1->4)-alpha-D-glucan 1-alpha-D-glucosylmutase
MMPPSIPLATYRLQLTAQFGFDRAAALVPYLAALGISHLYVSPFLKARSGSTHGYDVVDHNALNPELGGAEGFERLSAALSDAGLGLILDFVPNHMGVHHADNAWWLDVLEWGPRSPFADSFDIDWPLLPHWPAGGVLLPILGTSYGEALESGDIELRYDAAEGSFSAWYFEHRLPIGPNRYGEILQRVVVAADAGETPAGQSLLDLAGRYRGPGNPSRARAPALKSELAAIEGARDIIGRGLAAYRPTSVGSAETLALHSLLERQHFRLAHWRLSVSEINYRRFFDVNGLAGLRVEDIATFNAIHRLVGRLIADRRLHGIRLDHIDGLRDPAQYCQRLQRLAGGRSQRSSLYTVVEKILAEGERLPRLAGVSGTTGYEWLNVISRVLVDGRGIPSLDRTWREASGEQRGFAEILIDAKRQVLATILSSEFTVLSRLLDRIAVGHYTTRDYTAQRLAAALELYIVHFPVYRTYIAGTAPAPADRAVIDATIARARAEWIGPDASIFDVLRDALTLDLVAPGRVGHSSARVRRFALKVQQFTGPMMAKSLEDTAFYRYHRLLALNEVGGEPTAEPLTIGQFHARMAARAKDGPHGLTATATHDTKRGEDARARLLALSELAGDWHEAVTHWRTLNAGLREQSDAPSQAHEYMIYQALVGAWPIEGWSQDLVERMQAYAVKAAREGKERTSWIDPDPHYEEGLTAYVARLLSHGRSAAFLDAFERFEQRVSLIGALNSLSQVALKITMPGVPDFYQGTELWDFSLVDPDNRRPVDFDARTALLAATADGPDWPALADHWRDGTVKLALTHTLLALRRRFPAVFTDGLYRPVPVSGPDADEVIAFARIAGRDAVIVAVGRLFGRATDSGRHWPRSDAWNATLDVEGFSRIADLLVPGREAKGSAIPVAGLFGPLPIAVLQARVTTAGGRRRKP